jgi:hypothetical protein
MYTPPEFPQLKSMRRGGLDLLKGRRKDDRESSSEARNSSLVPYNHPQWSRRDIEHRWGDPLESPRFRPEQFSTADW